MRSKLFVPGIRRELYAKALAGEADALSFDLEDSVPVDRKAEARAAVAEFVQTAAVREAAKLVIVRVNALRSEHFDDDVAALAVRGVTLINLPKAGSADDVRRAVAALERAEAKNGSAPIRLLVNIETPKGLRNAADIARAHERVAGLQLGLGDLFGPLGADRRDAGNVHAAMFAVRMAAGEAGVFACDGAYPDVQDDAGFRAEAGQAHRLGYVGKSCVHPRQVALANDVFRASEDEIGFARRVVDAAKAAAAQGRGAFLVDGRMIDLPYLKRAQALLAARASADAAS